MRTRWAAILLLGVIGCADSQVRSVCRLDVDCPAGEACVAGECAPVDRPPDPLLPTPPDLSNCAEPCGSVCCGDSLECRNGACIPRCESGLWCGPRGEELCCAVGEICTAERLCAQPPPDPPTCPEGNWEPELNACVQAFTTRSCDKPADKFGTPEVLWHAHFDDGYDQVVVTPIVIDVNRDGVAEVIAPFYSAETGIDAQASLRALSGLDGSLLWSIPASKDGVLGTSQLAAAVLRPGGPVVVVGQDADRRLAAFDGRSGELLWRSRAKDGTPWSCDMGWGAPAIVDLDGDVFAEVVCGFTVFGHDGVLKWHHPHASGPLGAVVAIADLNGDGRPDLTDGTTARRHDGALMWQLDTMGGVAAVADLVNSIGFPAPDGWPEVIVTRGGLLEVRDGASGFLRTWPVLLPTWDGYACYPHISAPGTGGAPAIADLDFDGRPEVVVASGECLAAMGVVFSEGKPEWRMYWGHRAIDESSAVTGVSLFDLDGDGLKDVIHASEFQLDLMQGIHGYPLARLPHCSGTLYEFPAVADVDGDGSVNIVVARNTFGSASLGCPQGALPGISVLREKQSLWSNARGIFNQHAYTATNVCDGVDPVCAGIDAPYGAYGAVPQDEPPHWEFAPAGDGRPWNFVRSNSSGAHRPRAAANARITHVVADSGDPAQLKLRLINDGEAPLRAGTLIEVREANAAEPLALRTSRVVAPGRSLVLSAQTPTEWNCAWGCQLSAIADVDDRTAECDETDNLFAP